MSPLLITLKVVYAILGSITMGVLIYQIVMALLSGRRNKQPVPSCDRYNRFALVISARNESAVIAQLLDSLMAQRYPKE